MSTSGINAAQIAIICIGTSDRDQRFTGRMKRRHDMSVDDLYAVIIAFERI